MGELITNLLQAIIAAAVPVITAFVVKWLNALREKLETATGIAIDQAYANDISAAVATAVEYTAQTFVDVRKKSRDWTAWNKDAAKEALNQAIIEANKLLDKGALDYIQQLHGSIHDYLATLIEARLHELKRIDRRAAGGEAHE